MSKQLGSRFVTGDWWCGVRWAVFVFEGKWKPVGDKYYEGFMSYYAGISIMHNYIRVSLLLK